MAEKSRIDDSAAADAVRLVCASAAFINAPQLRRLLEFLLACAIARQHNLKAYTVGVDGLGRPDDFDPERDPIVRVQASRLRRALSNYYETEGARDDIRVHLPSRGYDLVFEQRPPMPDELPKSSRPWRLALIVAAVAGLLIAVAVRMRDGDAIDGSAMADRSADRSVASPRGNGLPTIVIRPFEFQGPPERFGLRVFISSAFSRFETVNTVYIPRSDRPAPVASVADQDGRYELKTYVSSAGDQSELTFRLVDLADGSTIWTRIFAVPRDRSLPATQKLIVADLASTLLQPHGVITSHDLARHIRTKQGDPRYRCILQAMDALRSASEIEYASARRCLKETIKGNPSYSLAYVYLTMIDNKEFQYFPDSDPTGKSTLENTLRMARQAVETNPASSRAQYAMYLTLFSLGDFDMAATAIAKAIALNEFNMPMRVEHAGRLITLGKVDEGMAIFDTIDHLFAARTCTHEFYLFLGHHLRHQPREATHHAKQITCPAFPYRLIAEALVASVANDAQAARKHVQDLRDRFPIWRMAPKSALARFFPAAELADRIMRELAPAGLE